MYGLLFAALLPFLTTGTDAITAGSAVGKARQTRIYMEGLARDHLLAGSFAAHYGPAGIAYEEAYGFSEPEYELPLTPYHRLPIGSNTKLFTSVAVWQLYHRGLLDLDAPVIQYMDKADFNQTEDWCPQLYGSNSTECIYPNLKQMLMMSSGMIDVDNCAYQPSDWQRAFCYPPDQVANLIGPNQPKENLAGGHSPAEYFVAQGYWRWKLQALPGTEYHYVNANFLLSQYVIEKVTGMSYGQYLRKHILVPAALDSISYDITYGNFGVVKNCTTSPGYRAIFSPASELYVRKVNTTSNRPIDVFMTAPAGQFVENARTYSDPGWLAWGAGAGALYSTPRDTIKWWQTLLFQPQLLNLTQSTVKEMLNTYNPHSLTTGRFAQGIIVVPNSTYQPYGIELLHYIGGTPGDIQSPFVLHFTNPKVGNVNTTIAIHGIYTLSPEIGVAVNATTCQVADWRNGGKLTRIPARLCPSLSLTTNALRQQQYGRLLSLWSNATATAWRDAFVRLP